MFWFKVLYIFFSTTEALFYFFISLSGIKEIVAGSEKYSKCITIYFSIHYLKKMFRITTIRVSFNWV